jgi:hypothetical protein
MVLKGTARFMRMLNGERSWPVVLSNECPPVEEDIEFIPGLNNRGAFIEGEPVVSEDPFKAQGPPCCICFRPVDQDGTGFTMFETNESGFAHYECVMSANHKLKVIGGIRNWKNNWDAVREIALQNAAKAKAATGRRGMFLELD